MNTERFQPLISVIIPLYNKDDVVSRAIESVARQTYDNVELICVDDNSTDNSLAVARDLLDRCGVESTMVEFDRNRGANAARNAGLGRSNGHYVLMLDADDELKEIALEEKVSYISEYSDKDVLVSLGSVKRRGRSEVEPDRIDELPLESGNHELLRFVACTYKCMPFNSLLIRRKFFEAASLYLDEDVEICQEWLFNIRLLLSEPDLAVLKKRHYVVHRDSREGMWKSRTMEEQLNLTTDTFRCADTVLEDSGFRRHLGGAAFLLGRGYARGGYFIRGWKWFRRAVVLSGGDSECFLRKWFRRGERLLYEIDWRLYFAALCVKSLVSPRR